MEHRPEVTYPATELVPTLAQAACPCGWEGPPRVIEQPGPRNLLEVDIRQHLRDRPCRTGDADPPPARSPAVPS